MCPNDLGIGFKRVADYLGSLLFLLQIFRNIQLMIISYSKACNSYLSLNILYIRVGTPEDL